MKFNKKIALICILTVLQYLSSTNLHSEFEWPNTGVVLAIEPGNTMLLLNADLKRLEPDLLQAMLEEEEIPAEEAPELPTPMVNEQALKDIVAYFRTEELPDDPGRLGEMCWCLDHLRANTTCDLAKELVSRFKSLKELKKFGSELKHLEIACPPYSKYCQIPAVLYRLRCSLGYSVLLKINASAGRYLNRFQCSPDGTLILAISSPDPVATVCIWDAATGRYT